MNIKEFIWWAVAFYLSILLGWYINEYTLKEEEKEEEENISEWREISRDTIPLEETQQYDTLPRRYKIVFE